jgi:exonuclease III
MKYQTKKNKKHEKYQTKKYKKHEKYSKKGGNGTDITNPEWNYKKICKPPRKICGKDKINFALCVENEADCDKEDYDYHYNPRTSNVAVNTFNVERFNVQPNDELNSEEKDKIHRDVIIQEATGRFKSYVPEFSPTSCYIQKKNSVSSDYDYDYDSLGYANKVPQEFSIVTQNALGLYFGKHEAELDLSQPQDAKNKAILNIMRLRTAYFRKFLSESGNPDFLCFQEMTPEFLNFLYTDSATMKETYKYVYPDKQNFDELIKRKADAVTFMISKHPAIKHTTYMLQGNSNYYNSLSVTEFDNLVIFNVYLQAGSKFSPGLKYNWENYSRCRRQQLKFIKSLIDSYGNQKAIIVLGDFNFELNSIHYDGTSDDTENWSELTFLKALNLKDSFKTLHPGESGLTEDTAKNTLRFLGKLEHKSLRYDGIFFNDNLTPTISKVVNDEPLKINAENRSSLDVPFDPDETNTDYELALVFKPGNSINATLEEYKEQHDLKTEYELFVSDHFGVMTTFKFIEVATESGGKKNTKKQRYKRKARKTRKH